MYKIPRVKTNNEERRFSRTQLEIHPSTLRGSAGVSPKNKLNLPGKDAQSRALSIEMFYCECIWSHHFDVTGSSPRQRRRIFTTVNLQITRNQQGGGGPAHRDKSGKWGTSQSKREPPSLSTCLNNGGNPQGEGCLGYETVAIEMFYCECKAVP